MIKLRYLFLFVFSFIIGISFIHSKNYSDYYDPDNLSKYFGKNSNCTNDGSENDCRNGDEYKFYLKMYDIYYLYKNKYNVTLDLPLIMSTLYYGDSQLPTVFTNNLNSYNRDALKDTNNITNIDWEYDYKNIDGYQYLDSDNSCFDMQILAKNMVTKTITYKCSDGTSKETKDIEKSNYSNETLPCDNGSYDKNSISEKYEYDKDKYDEFLLEYIKLKYHTKGSGKKYNGGDSFNSNSNINISKTGKEAIDKMNEIALSQVGNGGLSYWSWYGFSYRVEWCAVFTSWLFNQVDGLNKYIKSSASAGEIPRASVAAGYGTWYEDECTDPSTIPQAGDVIVFDPWVNGTYLPYPKHGEDKYYSSHVGYVYKVDDEYVYTVEGNSSDVVKQRQYSRKSHCGTSGIQGINGYFRPNY